MKLETTEELLRRYIRSLEVELAKERVRVVAAEAAEKEAADSRDMWKARADAAEATLADHGPDGHNLSNLEYVEAVKAVLVQRDAARGDAARLVEALRGTTSLLSYPDCEHGSDCEFCYREGGITTRNRTLIREALAAHDALTKETS